MQPSNSSGNNSGNPPAQSNPILQSYQAWSERTPFVTRVTTITLVVLYIFSFFIRFDLFLADIPYFTLFHFEIYRLILSPFIGNSILFLVLLLFTFPAIGLKMESTMGSGYFLWLIMTINLLINGIFNIICVTLYAFGMKEALFWNCFTFWTILFALITIDCMQMPDVPRRMLCLPVDIPSKYMPVALYALMALFSGPSLAYLLSLLLGYAYVLGYMDHLKPTSHSLAALEQPGQWLHSVSRASGWVLAGTLGHDAFVPTNRAQAQSSGSAPQTRTDPMSRVGLLSGAGTGEDDDKPKEQFPGSGHKLSNTGSVGMPFLSSNTNKSAPTREELAAKRLAALSTNQHTV